MGRRRCRGIIDERVRDSIMTIKEIKWDNNDKLEIEIVLSVENLWKIKFPKNYVNLISQHDSANPLLKDKNGEWEYGIIDIPNWHGKATEFGFISYTTAKYFNTLSIIHFYEALKDRLPEPDKIFPFASTGSGDILFFDYRKNPDEPAIVFMDHEEAFTEEDITQAELKEKPVKEWLEMNLFPVCNSFSELLDLLYIDEED